MPNFLILVFLFSLFYLVDPFTAVPNPNSKVAPPGVNDYKLTSLVIRTKFMSRDDGVQVQALAYRISWYFWWWCLRICKSYYWSNGNWWIVYDVYYWYPCWRLGWPWWPWWTLAATQVTPATICGDFQNGKMGFFDKALMAEDRFIDSAQFSCGNMTTPVKGQGGQAPTQSDNDVTSNLPQKAVVFEVTTKFKLNDDIRKVHALTYYVIRPYWWWCFRICTYQYWNGFFWIARYSIIYRYPCWPWFYPVNLVRPPTDPGIIGPIQSYDDKFDRYDLVAFAKEALNVDPVNIRKVCLIIGDQFYDFAPACYKQDPTC